MPQLKQKRRLIAVSAVALTLSSGSVLAYRHFFHRAGEAAVALIPADSLMVFTLDTNPSPSQVTLFNKLRETFRTYGLGDGIDELFADKDGKPSPMGQLRPFLTDNYAAVLLGDVDFNSKSMPEMAYFVSVSDRDGILKWLKTNATFSRSLGLEYYRIKEMDSVAILEDGYLVVAPQLTSLRKCAEVAAHRKPSLETTNEYREARASLDADANFMGFISPRAYKSFIKNMEDTASRGGRKNKAFSGFAPMEGMFNAVSWMAVSATVRAEGLQIKYFAPIDATKSPFWSTFARVKPLSASSLKALPANPYLVYSVSQPTLVLDALEEVWTSDATSKKDFNDGLKEFQKESGLSLSDDILPALRGQATLALYPDQTNPDGFIDGVVYITDENNGDPASLSQKIKTIIEKKAAKKGGKPVRFTTTQKGSVTLIALDTKSANSMRTSLTDMIEPKPGQYRGAVPPSRRPSPKYATPRKKRKASKLRTASYKGMNIGLNTETKHKRGDYVNGKTIVWAIVGRSIILATSEAMLEKALDSAEGRSPSVATDPNSVALQDALTQGTQTWSWIGVGQIMQRLRPFIEESFKDGSKEGDDTIASDIVNLFGGANAGLYAQGKYDGKTSQGTVFYPLDWDRALQLGGKFSKQANKNKIKPVIADDTL